ncbi:DUF4363 family protein [Anaeroselena agilis]|uniref:Uncharacterized protein n=1 Tax=Anaeroselena agilis TaxID=3063788 RepID=A0ABU3NUG8_9FIRM|nr:hypothetical protein [Selenomonadales bacterium 4137-cl]
MFDRTEISYYIMAAWIIGLAAMTVLFNFAIPHREMNNRIDALTSQIEVGEWQTAANEVEVIKMLWERNRFIIQLANASEEMVVFEERLGELGQAVKHRNSATLPSAGALKKMAASVTDPFPGP